MQLESKRRPNNLGARGWFWAGNYTLERYLYILHRVTGIGLILFTLFHLIETTFFRIQGESVWESTMSLLHHPVFEVGIALVSIAFVFHALNGIRLLLMEFGITLGKPIRPVFPFKDALRRRRIVTGIIGLLAAAGIVLFLINFFLGGA
jgi:succinate dehydrogenase / fumarate reductase, cytochrome b subunit